MSIASDPLSAALEETLARFARMVKGVGWRYRFSDAELDELVQDVRIRLWRARGDGENVAAAPASYVYRTATTAALDLIRRRRARREEAVGPEWFEGLADGPGSGLAPERALEERALEERLLRAVEALADARRTVVRLHLAGYGREEIAELLGWTEARTRNLLYRGLSDLRRGLGQGTGEEGGP
jgi:RNA polymerase sigma factor (sigma-70 family)